MENPQVTPLQEYKEPFSILKSIGFGLLGAVAAVGPWLFLANMNKFHTAMPLLLGGFISAGVRYKQPKDQFFSMIIGLLIVIPALFIADFAETALSYGSFSLSINEYLAAFLSKFSDRFILYFGATTFPIVLEFILRRIEADGGLD